MKTKIWSMVVLCGIATMLDFRLGLQTLVMAGIRGAGPEYKYEATFGLRKSFLKHLMLQLELFEDFSNLMYLFKRHTGV